jgi:hypothetical protein
VAPVLPCHKNVTSSVLSGIQGDHKMTVKRMQRRQIQNRGRDAKLLLFLVNSYAQVRSQCFSAKAVCAPLKILVKLHDKSESTQVRGEDR